MTTYLVQSCYENEWEKATKNDLKIKNPREMKTKYSIQNLIGTEAKSSEAKEKL